MTGLVALSASGDLAGPLYNGLVLGSVYGLIALGIVLVYKSNRIFNFVQAEFGTVAALCVASVAGTSGFAAKAGASVGAVALAGLLGLLSYLLVVRPLFRTPRVTLLVATAGITLLMISVELIVGGPRLYALSPLRDRPVATLFGDAGDPTSVNVLAPDLLIGVTLVALALATTAFFRTRYGTAILAVSQEPTAASLVGVDVGRVSALTWTLSGLIGGVAGVVYAFKVQSLSPGALTLTGPLINGVVAAVLGGVASLTGAFVGGLLLGVLQTFAVSVAPPAVTGAGSLAVLAVLLVVLLVRPQGLFKVAA